MKKTHAAITGKGSILARYQDVVVGKRSKLFLLYFEWCLLLSPVPGALGMLLRKVFWPRLFGTCGKGCMFAPGIILRHPRRIHLGRSVVVSERCLLDARNDASEQVIELGDDVILSNDVVLSCKQGSIRIDEHVGVNSQTIIQSTNNCPVAINRDCIIGQRCLIIGGGSYNLDRLDIPIRQQGIRDDGGIVLKENVWLGGNVSVLGGVVMGAGSVAGTGAVVTDSIPENAICLGVPAKVVRQRT